MSKNSKGTKPLPLGDTLRDLALLRASDIDLASLLQSGAFISKPVQPENPSTIRTEIATNDTIEASLERSFEFIREARTAIKIHNRGDVDKQGSKVEDVRSKLEDVLKGLSG